MLFSRSIDLEDRIIELLLEERLTLKSLHSKLTSEEKSLSLRAIYKTVDKLIAAKVLLKVGKRVMVDEEWLRRVGEKLRVTSVPAPSVGERITYTFTSTENLDAFWKTVVLPIEETAPSKEIFFYNPHNFWAYLPDRKESEEAYYQHFSKTGQRGFFTVGGAAEADGEYKREYQSEHLQIDLREVSALRRSEHLTLIGSLLITVRLGKTLVSRIDELYASNRSIKDILPELLAICQNPGSIKFIIENNPLKAKKLKKLLARNFYFPQRK